MRLCLRECVCLRLFWNEFRRTRYSQNTAGKSSGKIISPRAFGRRTHDGRAGWHKYQHKLGTAGQRVRLCSIRSSETSTRPFIPVVMRHAGAHCSLSQHNIVKYAAGFIKRDKKWKYEPSKYGSVEFYSFAYNATHLNSCLVFQFSVRH